MINSANVYQLIQKKRILVTHNKKHTTNKGPCLTQCLRKKTREFFIPSMFLIILHKINLLVMDFNRTYRSVSIFQNGVVPHSYLQNLGKVKYLVDRVLGYLFWVKTHECVSVLISTLLRTNFEKIKPNILENEETQLQQKHTSSKSTRGGFFNKVRAMATRCFSPPLIFKPRSPTKVS